MDTNGWKKKKKKKHHYVTSTQNFEVKSLPTKYSNFFPYLKFGLARSDTQSLCYIVKNQIKKKKKLLRKQKLKHYTPSNFWWSSHILQNLSLGFDSYKSTNKTLSV